MKRNGFWRSWKRINRATCHRLTVKICGSLRITGSWIPRSPLKEFPIKVCEHVRASDSSLNYKYKTDIRWRSKITSYRFFILARLLSNFFSNFLFHMLIRRQRSWNRWILPGMKKRWKKRRKKDSQAVTKSLMKNCSGTKGKGKVNRCILDTSLLFYNLITSNKVKDERKYQRNEYRWYRKYYWIVTQKREL